MKVPVSLKECVCYVCTKKKDRWAYFGTAFFVSIETSDHFHKYLVTAKHVLIKIQEMGGDVYLRINTSNDKAEFIEIKSEWYYPDSPAVDIAVLPLTLPEEEVLQYRTVPQRMIVTDKIINDEYNLIGIGSDVLVSGLFSLRHGTQKNYPIVRSGIIASMPDEQLQDDMGELYDAYLIEIRSIGGLSGSPVFVYFQVDTPERNRFDIYLLGLIRGHWNIAAPAVKSAFVSDGEAINTGIAIVTPAEEILKLLEREDLAKLRRECDRERAKQNQPTLD